MSADGYMPDGTPVYFATGRMSGKSTLQLAIYAKLCGVPIDEAIKTLKEKYKEDEMEAQEVRDRLAQHVCHIDTKVCENFDAELWELKSALEYAIEAVEKDIEKHVVIKREFGTQCGREYYACPNCGEYIRYAWTLEPPTYPCCCDECGQRLDWEGE